LTQRHSSKEAGIEGGMQELVDAALAVADDEFFQCRGFECQLEAVVFAKLFGGVARFLQAEIGGFAEAFGAEEGKVDRSAEGEEALVGARRCSWLFRGGCVARGFAA